MGELLPKGQLAIELAADQRLVALIHLAQSEEPSDRNPRANTLNRQPDHCPLKKKREGWVGFGECQFPVDQYRRSEPVNWSTAMQVV